jgi:exonuclease III
LIRIASLNVNRGLSTRRNAINAWCGIRSVDVLLLQEPWPRGKQLPLPALGSLEYIAGNDMIAVFARSGLVSKHVLHEPRHQSVLVGELHVHNLYLDASSSRKREQLLLSVAERLEDHVPTLVMGDFNMSPRPADGLFDGIPSKFTKQYERRALARIFDFGFRDLGATDEPDFTFERVHMGILSQWRCDLALLRHPEPVPSFVYGHETRLGEDKFTDHSGVILDLNR